MKRFLFRLETAPINASHQIVVIPSGFNGRCEAHRRNVRYERLREESFAEGSETQRAVTLVACCKGFECSHHVGKKRLLGMTTVKQAGWSEGVRSEGKRD